MPARYGLLVLGSGLLMFGCAASAPLGVDALTVGRQALAVGASAVGLAALLASCLCIPTFTLLTRASHWYTRFHGAPIALTLTLILALGTVLTFTGAANLMLREPAQQAYQTDTISFADENARLLLAGRNPYTTNGGFLVAIRAYPHALATPLRAPSYARGHIALSFNEIAATQRQYIAAPANVRNESKAFDPRTLHSYPAFSFLLYAPAIWAGLDDILAVNVILYWLLFGWLVWQAPVGWRHWGALVALAGMPTVAASLLTADEVVCVALILLAWHWRRQFAASAILLGLACAYKQYAWFFAPFFILEILRESGWRRTLCWGALALVAFLAPNLPFLIASPVAWFQSLWLPMSEPFYPEGLGLISLAMVHLLPANPPTLYTALEALALVASLVAAWRWRRALGDGVLLLALVPLFFAFRSLPDYFAFAPWLALYAVNRIYAERGAHTQLAVTRAVASGATAAASAMYRRLAGAPPGLGVAWLLSNFPLL